MIKSSQSSSRLAVHYCPSAWRRLQGRTSKHLIVTFMIVAQTDNATMDLTVHLEMTSSLAHNFHSSHHSIMPRRKILHAKYRRGIIPLTRVPAGSGEAGTHRCGRMTAMILKQEAALQRQRRRLLAAVPVTVTMMPMMVVMDRGGDRGGRGGVRPVQQ